MIAFDRIVDGIFIGTCPENRLDAERLSQNRITAVFNLQSDADLVARQIHWADLEQAYLELGISPYRAPIIDFDDADMAALLPNAVATLAAVIKEYSRVYVHCTAGQQRSPSAVIGYLAWHCGYDLEEAITLVMSTRKCAPPLHVIRALDATRG